jgi:hypothetical protein
MLLCNQKGAKGDFLYLELSDLRIQICCRKVVPEEEIN